MGGRTGKHRPAVVATGVGLSGELGWSGWVLEGVPQPVAPRSRLPAQTRHSGHEHEQLLRAGTCVSPVSTGPEQRVHGVCAASLRGVVQSGPAFVVGEACVLPQGRGGAEEREDFYGRTALRQLEGRAGHVNGRSECYSECR